MQETAYSFQYTNLDQACYELRDDHEMATRRHAYDHRQAMYWISVLEEVRISHITIKELNTLNVACFHLMGFDSASYLRAVADGQVSAASRRLHVLSEEPAGARS